MEDDIADVALRDVFISHAWGDKHVIEPLVAALQGSDVTCWYDLLELRPGDSLIDGINKGLTHCKIVLFCLSENFLKGNWTPKELNAAFALSAIHEQAVTRLVPLMMTDPNVIVEKYPVQFGGRLYIRWDEEDMDHVVDQLKKVLSEVDVVSKEYWYRDSQRAYVDGDYVKAALSARKAVDTDPKYFPASVLYVAAALHLDRPMDAYRFIFQKEDDWMAGLDESGVDTSILDYVQNTLTEAVVGNEIPETGFSFSLVHFLATDTNGDRAWRYLVRLFDKDDFRFRQDDIVLYAVLKGRESAIEWLRTRPMMSHEEKVKETLANLFYIMAVKLPAYRQGVTEMAKQLAADEYEDVRAAALPVLYRFAKDGEGMTSEALSDRSPMVRMVAFELLAGLHNVEVDDDWTPKRGESTDPALCFGPEMVQRMLNDPDEMVFEGVVEMISDGKIDCPPGIDITQIQRPAIEEVREAVVKTLAKQDTEESHQRLMKMALEDPGEFVRSEAIEALEKSERPLPGSYLRQLWEAETISRVKSDLDSLILEKGCDDMPDVYLDILERNMDSSYSSEKAFQKLAGSGDAEFIRRGLDVCSAAGKNEIPVSGVRKVIEANLVEEAATVVRWCLEHGKEEALAILTSGRLPAIPLQMIYHYRDHGNPILRADCLRAMENRLGDGAGLRELRELYETLKPGVLEKNNDSMWASLEVIDGIIEFGTVDEAIKLLKDYYEVVDRLTEGGSFPLRAAWERLRVLGVSIPHPVYDPTDHSTPYPWPSEGGPFYGISNRSS